MWPSRWVACAEYHVNICVFSFGLPLLLSKQLGYHLTSKQVSATSHPNYSIHTFRALVALHTGVL
jgi:hypothetical protein